MYVECVDLLVLIVQLMDAGRLAIMSPTTVTITNITKRWRGGNPTETVERLSPRLVVVWLRSSRSSTGSSSGMIPAAGQAPLPIRRRLRAPYNGPLQRATPKRTGSRKLSKCLPDLWDTIRINKIMKIWKIPEIPEIHIFHIFQIFPLKGCGCAVL